MSEKRSVGRPQITPEAQEAFRIKISTVAQHLFFKEGFESVSMRRIATELGCHPMSLYKYFDSKYAILQAIWEVVFEELHSHCSEAVTKAQGPEKKLKTMCLTYMRFWLDRPEYFKVVFLTADPKSIQIGKAIYVSGSAVEKILLLIKTLAEACQKANILKPRDSDEILQFLYSGMLGTILCMVSTPEYPWMAADEYTEKVIDNILRGLSV